MGGRGDPYAESGIPFGMRLGMVLQNLGALQEGRGSAGFADMGAMMRNAQLQKRQALEDERSEREWQREEEKYRRGLADEEKQLQMDEAFLAKRPELREIYNLDKAGFRKYVFDQRVTKDTATAEEAKVAKDVAIKKAEEAEQLALFKKLSPGGLTVDEMAELDRAKAIEMGISEAAAAKLRQTQMEGLGLSGDQGAPVGVATTGGPQIPGGMQGGIGPSGGAADAAPVAEQPQKGMWDDQVTEQVRGALASTYGISNLDVEDAKRLYNVHVSDPAAAEKMADNMRQSDKYKPAKPVGDTFVTQDQNGNFTTKQRFDDGTVEVVPMGEGEKTIDVIEAERNKEAAKAQEWVQQSTAKNAAADLKKAAQILQDEVVMGNDQVTGGIASTAMSYDASSPTGRISNLMEQALANLTLQAIQDMRTKAMAAGSTGTGFGSLTEKEMGVLQKAYANLGINLPPEELYANMVDAYNILQRVSGGEGISLPNQIPKTLSKDTPRGAPADPRAIRKKAEPTAAAPASTQEKIAAALAPAGGGGGDIRPVAGFQEGMGRAIRNVPGSAWNTVVSQIGQVLDPVGTATGMNDMLSGGVERLMDAGNRKLVEMGMPGARPREAASPEVQRQKDVVGQIGNAIYDRMGTKENAWRSFQQDPVGMAADVGSVAAIPFTGGASALRSFGRATNLARIGTTPASRMVGNISEQSAAKVIARNQTDAKIKAAKDAAYSVGEASGRSLPPTHRVTVKRQMTNDIMNHNPKITPRAKALGAQIMKDIGDPNVPVNARTLEQQRQRINKFINGLPKTPENAAERAAAMRLKLTIDKTLNRIGADVPKLKEARNLAGREAKIANWKAVTKKVPGYIESRDAGIRGQLGAQVRKPGDRLNPVELQTAERAIARGQDTIAMDVLDRVPMIGPALSGGIRKVKAAMTQGDLGILQNLARMSPEQQRMIGKIRGAGEAGYNTYMDLANMMRERPKGPR